jgi:MFS family permease
MIVTRKAVVPWSWVWLSQLPFAFWMFVQPLQSTAFTFSLRKFLDNPASIATTLSLAQLPVLFIAPVVNYITDKIWTRWGRRKPFYVISNAFCALITICMPFAPNALILTILLWLFYLGIGFGKTFFPLSQEIVPVPQRGRASALHAIMFQLGLLLYFSVLIGRFDDVFTSPPLAFFGSTSGETFIYGISALAMLLPTLILCLGIKELPLPSDAALKAEPHRSMAKKIRDFFVEIFDPQWSVLYLLLFGGSLYTMGLGSLGGLLYTDQWGYTKQEMGTNIAIGGIILLPLAFVGGQLADRFSKMSVYIACLVATLIINIGYYLFVTVALAGGRPTLWEIILFGELGAVCSTLAAIVQWPLIFEYIPRSKMGTASAGMELMQSIYGLILGPLVGFWVVAYSSFFTPPAGFQNQIEFAQAATTAGVQQVIDQSKSQPIHRLIVKSNDPTNKKWVLFLKNSEQGATPENGESTNVENLIKQEFSTFGVQTVHAEFIPKRYDYFSAYLLVILGGVLAIGIIFLVRAFEARGIIRKLGVIEEGLES